MKALTVRQPYAHWMFTPDDEFGIKSIENRTRGTSYRGELLIHAGAQPHADYKGTRYITDAMSFGAILGSVELVDCHPAVDGCCDRDWAEFGYRIFHWVLANPRALPEPILDVKGQLGLWEYQLEGKAA